MLKIFLRAFIAFCGIALGSIVLTEAVCINTKKINALLNEVNN